MTFKIDFIGVGVQKAATTWIWKCLVDHPEVCSKPSKEIHFFNKERSAFNPLPEWKYKRGIEWYKNFFKDCDYNKIKGEWSPHYMVDQEVPRLIKKHFPETKILASLRDPVNRAYSQYYHVILDPRNDYDFESFEEAVESQAEFLEKGFYYKQLKEYFERFPRENIKILIYEDIADDPVNFIQDVYRFLEIDDSYEPSMAQTKISSKEAKSSWLGKFIRKSTTGIRKTALGKKIANSSLARNMFYWLTGKFFMQRKVPEMDEETEKELRKIYKEDINNLEKLIGRNLNSWK